jgi:spermidine dehydrogenase
MNEEDRDLGMGRAISRRDFVNGVAVAAGAGAIVAQTASSAFAQAAGDVSGDAMTVANYPPLRQGLRGDHPGSYEDAPGMNNGRPLPDPESTGETYDLVVVGAGLSGLAAAWYYREKAGPTARILVLDNHDDFGGHAKRDEFVYQGHKLMASGGSDYFVSTVTWPYEAMRMVKALGVDTSKQAGQMHPEIYQSYGLAPATFFAKEIYGRDVLVHGATPQRPTADFLAKAPLSSQVKIDLMRLMNDEKVDYLPGLSNADKIAKLRSMTYRDYLLNVVKLHPDVLPYTNGVWCLSNDTVTAWFAYFRYKPGFAGLGLTRPEGSPESPEHEAHNFPFPGGNHSFARLIVRSLIPDALPTGDFVTVETYRTNYAALDRPGQPTRIRLGSIVFRAKHVGTLPNQFEPDKREVEVSYITGGKSYSVRAKDVVMAGMNNVIPYICPELPEAQKAALRLSVRAINHHVYALLRDWQAFAKLKVANIACPQAFYPTFGLQASRSFGDLKPSMDPSQPVLVSFGGGAGISSEGYIKELLGGTLPPPGTSVRDQMNMARAGLLRTPFERFERAVRRQMSGALSGSGFDPARDIVGLTVNRWGHGYALGRNQLFDDESGAGPFEIGRKKFGHITIANSDASGIDNAQTAMDEAARAVRELEPRMYGYYESI